MPTDSYLYKAYGELLAPSGSTTNNFRWVGRQGYYFDSLAAGALNQHYVRARHYSPILARWLSQDPLGFTETSNLFDYCHLTPTFLVDPSGEHPDLGEIVIGAGELGEIIGAIPAGTIIVGIVIVAGIAYITYEYFFGPGCCCFCGLRYVGYGTELECLARNLSPGAFGRSLWFGILECRCR